jgi:hypothetical protein
MSSWCSDKACGLYGSGFDSEQWEVIVSLLHWVLGFLSWGQSGRGVNLTSRFDLVPRLRLKGAMRVLPYMPSWRRQG